MPRTTAARKPPARMTPRSRAEELLMFQLKATGYRGWVREHRFHPVRRWRFDFAWPELLLAVEIQGMGRRGKMGAHQRPAGIKRDCDKGNEALILGWRLLHVTTDQVKSGAAIRMIERALGASKPDLRETK